MGRLIDADKLLEETRRDRDYARKNGFLDMYYERQVLIDRIKAQPTAYYPEKVVEQLETMRMRYYLTYANTGNKTNDEVWEKASRAVDKAIEIVKKEAEQYNNGWIPCSSGVMPRANGWYLVTNYLGVVQEQRWSANHWEKLRDDAVLAWRELPYPYQPKGE